MLDQVTPLRLGALGVGLFLAVILGTFGIMAMHRSAYERCQATPSDDPIAMNAGSAEAPSADDCVNRRLTIQFVNYGLTAAGGLTWRDLQHSPDSLN